MLKKWIRRGLDVYLACIAAWVVAWTAVRDRKGALALVNAWAFWLLGPALPLGAARLLTAGRKRRGKVAAVGPALALVWLGGGAALLAGRYRWLLRGLPGDAARKIGPAARSDAGQGSTSGPGRPAPAQRLRALSFNVPVENERPDSVLELVRRENADVVLIQELEPGMNQALFAGLEEYEYCHWQSHHKPGGGFGFFSRYPFEVTGLWDSPATRPYAARITLNMPGGPVDIYNVHLVSVGPKAMRKTGLDGNFRVREGQVDAVADEIAARRIPALALGDCNMTEGNEAYQRAAARMTDAWLAAGRGPGWTWPRRWGISKDSDRRTQPMLRLDYCFCSPEVRPVAMRVLYDDVGSDHCPIVVDALV